jgi:hypothetical protein
MTVFKSNGNTATAVSTYVSGNHVEELLSQLYN